MSLEQIVDEIKQLSADELEELGFELDKARLMRLSHEMAARWAGKTFDSRLPSELPKPSSPFDELIHHPKS